MYKSLHIPCLQTLDELKAKCKSLNIRLILPDNLKEQNKNKSNIKRSIELDKLEQQKIKRLKTDLENGQMNGQLDNQLNGQLDNELNCILKNGKVNVKFNTAILIESAKVNSILNNNNDLIQYNKLSNSILVEKDEFNNFKKIINVKLVNGILESDKINGSINGTSINGTSINGTSINGTSINGTSINEMSIDDNTIFESGKFSRFYKKDESIGDIIKNLDNFKQLEETFNFHMQLNKYAKELNELLVNFNNKPVVVENKVDQQLPPKFTYINEYNFDALDKSTVKMIENNVQKCNCIHDCESYISKNSTSCCSFTYGNSSSFYNCAGLIKHTVVNRGPIFECSKFCNCSQKCPNRVIQKGTQVNLAIFKTNDGRGWGLKALEKIPKNKFICSYRGQVITSDEALKRQSTSPFNDRYFFDLDYSEDLQFEYVVDATNYSNLGRFLNHSCMPNCETFIAYIETAYMKIPVISFFTNTFILPGQELTIDYFHENNPSELPESKVKCLCKSSNCRDYAF